MRILRKRYIPDEVVDISGDEVIYHDEKRFITKWLPIKPRGDIAAGESCVYFEHGWKVSKFFRQDGSLKFWYCDIIHCDYDAEEDTYLFTDLLLDVIVQEEGHYEILDEDELEEALEKGIITPAIAEEAKTKLRQLVELIQAGRFGELKF